MGFRQLTESTAALDPERRPAWVARWAGIAPDLLEDWEEEPDYGAFVDDEGRVQIGSVPAGASLSTGELHGLELSPSLQALRQQNPGALLVFLDWGNQSLAWDEVFSLWDRWETEGLVLACGPVQVSYELETNWKVPAFLLLRTETSLGGLLGTHVGEVETAAHPSYAVAPVSLLARAKAFREQANSPQVHLETSDEPLPMIPFTLETLEHLDKPPRTGLF